MENLVKSFKNKKVLITGHTGFKGSWLSKILLNWGADVSGISLRPATKPNLFHSLGIKDCVTNYYADIRDYRRINRIMMAEKPEIVFHLAAQPLVRKSYNYPLYTFETNTLGTVNILEAIKKVGSVKAAVMITTDKVYLNKELGRAFKEEDPLGGHDPYSASKAAAEIKIDSYRKSFFPPEDFNKKHSTLVASARAGNVIGGGDWSEDRLIPDLIKNIFNKKPLIIRSPEAVRPWQYVLEPIYGYLLLAKELYHGKKEYADAWNFGPNKNNFKTVKEIVDPAIKIIGKGTYTIQKNNDGKHENKFLTLDSKKAQSELGWKPKLDALNALKLTLEWYDSFYKKEDMVRVTDDQIKMFFKETR